MPYGQSLRSLSPSIGMAPVLASVLPEGSRVLEIGCGRGDTLRELAAGGAYSLCAADVDGELLEQAKESCPGVQFSLAGAEALPYPDGFFDAVLLECVFSLLTRPADAAASIHRVLRPGGLLFLADLCAPGRGFALAEQELVRNVYSRGELEAFFSSGFSVASFGDRTKDLTQMMAQMVLDGVACGCAASLGVLREGKTGYGLWIFGKL